MSELQITPDPRRHDPQPEERSTYDYRPWTERARIAEQEVKRLREALEEIKDLDELHVVGIARGIARDALGSE